MPKMSRQKFKYLEDEKSFYDEIKSVFHNFSRAFTAGNNFFFSKGESLNLTRQDKQGVRHKTKRKETYI